MYIASVHPEPGSNSLNFKIYVNIFNYFSKKKKQYNFFRPNKIKDLKLLYYFGCPNRLELNQLFSGYEPDEMTVSLLGQK